MTSPPDRTTIGAPAPQDAGSQPPASQTPASQPPVPPPEAPPPAPGAAGRGQSLKPGDRIGRYELEQLLGEGAMAMVFAARHPLREKRLAIKILKPEATHDAQYVARFMGDARAADALDHPNIIRVIDVDDTPSNPFIVMEMIDGRTLEQLLAERGRLPIEEAARIGRDVAQALAAAHAAGIVHRDVKPSNILIDRRTGATKLTDFGAAKRERQDGASLTFHGQLIGTPRYMAPEQIEAGPVDARADIFALGATVYEMLMGSPAFPGEGLATVLHGVLHRDVEEPTQLRPEVPAELSRLVLQMLAKSPAARPASAAVIAEALARFADGSAVPPPQPVPEAAAPPPAKPTPPSPQPRPASQSSTPPPPPGGGDGGRSNRLPWLVIAGAVAALLAIGAWLLLAPGPTPLEEEPVVATPTPTPPPAEETPPPAPEPVAPTAPEPPAPTVTEPAPPAVPEPAGPDLAAVEAALAGLPCVTARVTLGEEGLVRLEGTAAAVDLAALAGNRAQGVPGVRAVENGLVVVEAPGCSAAARVQAAAEGGTAPLLTLNQPDGVYLDQDYLVVEAAMPEDLSGFLYVDVLTDNDRVFHLLPEPLEPENVLPAAGRIRLGVEAEERRAGVRYWQAGPPFGQGYVVATASERRLYEGVRPVEEPLADYLPILLEALADPGKGVQSVVVRPLEFRPRG